jgi:hypothetical protein
MSDTTLVTPLTDDERVRYQHNKSIVIDFISRSTVAEPALKEIRDQRLYREEFGTFEAFCTTVLNCTARRVNQLIQSVDLMQTLDPENGSQGSKFQNGQKPQCFEGISDGNHGSHIRNERQSRALHQVPEDKRETVISEATKNGKPLTASRITQAAKAISAKTAPVRRDKTGFKIPDDLISHFDRTEEFNRHFLGTITQLRSGLRDAQETKDALFREVNFNAAFSDLDNLWSNLKRAVPYAVCPYCQGVMRKTCTVCKATGVLSKFTFDTCVPENIKATRAKSCERK